MDSFYLVAMVLCTRPRRRVPARRGSKYWEPEAGYCLHDARLVDRLLTAHAYAHNIDNWTHPTRAIMSRVLSPTP